MSDLMMNKKGFMKVGSYRHKEERAEKGKKLSSQIKDLLKEDLVKYLKKNNPNGLEILMAWLAYESSPPNIDTCDSDRQYMLKCSRKEGVRFLYEQLERIGKEIENEHTNTRAASDN